MEVWRKSGWISNIFCQDGQTSPSSCWWWDGQWGKQKPCSFLKVQMTRATNLRLQAPSQAWDNLNLRNSKYILAQVLSFWHTFHQQRGEKTKQAVFSQSWKGYPCIYSVLTRTSLCARSLARPYDQASARVVMAAENKTQHPQAGTHTYTVSCCLMVRR